MSAELPPTAGRHHPHQPARAAAGCGLVRCSATAPVTQPPAPQHQQAAKAFAGITLASIDATDPLHPTVSTALKNSQADAAAYTPAELSGS